MAYGKIEYNEEGLPMCEECGLFFNRVTAHASQVHGIKARDYKLKHGLDLGKGVCSKESSERARQSILEHSDNIKNLIKAGKKTRLKKGNPGRTIDKISAQTMEQLRPSLIIHVHSKNLEALVAKEIENESKPKPKT